MKNHGHLYSGFVIMTIGLLFLLGNLGVISWSILSGFQQIWPLIIVAVGLNLFFNNHILIKLFTFTGLVAALVFTGVYYPASEDWNVNFDFRGGEHKSVSKVYPMENGISSAVLNLKMPAGALVITGQDENLMNAEFPDSYANENASTTDGGTRKVFNMDGGAFTFGTDDNDSWDYRYALNSSIPWDLVIDTGATEADLDFSGIILKNLELNSGAGDIDIQVGKVDRKANIVADVKASDFRVVIPEETGFRAVIKGSIHDIGIEGNNYTKVGNVYTSDNYQTAAQKVDLNLDVAVGDIQIERD